MSEPRSIGLHIWVRDEATQAIFDALGDNGDTVRFVGGCVRNALLGVPVGDIDMATVLPPQEVMQKLEAAGLKAHPTGIDHGTITGVARGVPHEITTLRKDVSTDGRRAVVAYTEDWSEDAARRDFTMNALYASRDGTVHDPLGGLVDLEARRVKFIGEAEQRIKEDFLRILRFFRIHAWYGRGDLDAEGLAACVANMDGLDGLSVERVRDELLKLISAPDPIALIRQMAASGILTHVLPERLDMERLARLAQIDASAFFEPDSVLRLGALLDGGVEDADMLAARLRLSNAETDRLKAMKKETPRIMSYMSVREMKRCLYRIGLEAFTDRSRILWALDPKENNAVNWRALLAMAEAWERPKLPLSGEQIIAAGVPSGPEVGRILGEIEDWWIDSDFIDDELSIVERLKAIIQATVI